MGGTARDDLSCILPWNSGGHLQPGPEEFEKSQIPEFKQGQANTFTFNSVKILLPHSSYDWIKKVSKFDVVVVPLFQVRKPRWIPAVSGPARRVKFRFPVDGFSRSKVKVSPETISNDPSRKSESVTKLKRILYNNFCQISNSDKKHEFMFCDSL